MNIKDKKDILLPKLYEFFTINDNINKMLPIIMGESKISIRVLDWFITNYSKDKRIYYKLEDKTFNVHMDYKLQLKGYKKKLFDPFCRKKRIPFYYNSEKYVITTIGQLNFFRWAISKKIIEFVYDNFELIYNDMQRKKIELIDSDNISNDSLLINNESSESNIKEHNYIKKQSCLKEQIEISFEF